MLGPRSTAVAALVMLMGAALTSCGGTSPTVDAHASQGPGAQAFAFARCMQQHGVTSFPDPIVHTNGGETSIKQVAPASVVQSPAFRSAQKACARLQPGPGSGGAGSDGPGRAVLLAFARCLRAHGLTNFPDPTPQGQVTAEMVKAAGINLHAPGFFEAARGCLSVTHGAITVAQLAAVIRHH